MVDEPEEADGGEGTEVGEVFRTVGLQRRDQAPAELLLDDVWIGNVVLAEGTKDES